MSSVLRPGKNAAWQVLDGEAVVIDLQSGRAVGLNGVGTLIWSVLNGRSEDEIAHVVVQEFRVDLATARQDVATFVDQLERYNLITRVDEERA